MMNAKAYIGDLNGGSLLLGDARKIASLLLQNISKEKSRVEIVENNILQRKSKHSALRVANTLQLRFENLGPDFWQDVIDSEGQEYTQLLMVSLVIQSPIVADFLKLVVAEQRRQYKPALPPQCWEQFIDEQCRRTPELANYSEATFDKMRRNTFRALAEAGYIDSVKSKQLQPVFLLTKTKKHLERLNRLDLESLLECTI